MNGRQAFIWAALVIPVIAQAVPAPSADMPSHFWGFGRRAVGLFRFKLVFYDLPEGMRVEGRGPHGEGRITQGNGIVPLENLKATASLSFKHPLGIPPTSPAAPEGRILVCSDLLADRVIASTPENGCAKKTWVNSEAKENQFCGILSVDGSTVYRFPVVQRVPATLARPIWLTEDGRRAVIGIGEKGTDDADCGYEFVKNIREAWVWEFPDRLRKLKGKTLPTNDEQGLRNLLAKGKL